MEDFLKKKAWFKLITTMTICTYDIHNTTAWSCLLNINKYSERGFSCPSDCLLFCKSVLHFFSAGCMCCSFQVVSRIPLFRRSGRIVDFFLFYFFYLFWMHCFIFTYWKRFILLHLFWSLYLFKLFRNPSDRYICTRNPRS